MARFMSIIVVAGLAVAALFTFQERAVVFARQVYDLALPCSQPIPYKIGSIDPRFHIATSSVLADSAIAAGVWNTAASTTLLVYDPAHAVLTVNLVYDDRQATIDKLAKLGITVSDDRASYDAVKAKYTALYAQYESDKAAFDAAYAAYQKDGAAYQAEVQQWNARGGAPQDVYSQLSAEKAALAARQSELQTQASAVNAEADTVNALVDELNRLASTLNLDASTYNNTGSTLGGEFEEGVFESTPGSERINVYEFDSQARLIRVLAHEFGHSLGLEHVSDPKAIMYALNQSSNKTPTAADIAELMRVCRK